MLSTAFAAVVRRLQMRPFRFHDLRHSHASQLLKAGVHPKVVSERLGHAGIGITLDTQEDAVHRLNAVLASAIQKTNVE
jgi:integrase